MAIRKSIESPPDRSARQPQIMNQNRQTRPDCSPLPLTTGTMLPSVDLRVVHKLSAFLMSTGLHCIACILQSLPQSLFILFSLHSSPLSNREERGLLCLCTVRIESPLLVSYSTTWALR